MGEANKSKIAESIFSLEMAIMNLRKAHSYISVILKRGMDHNVLYCGTEEDRIIFESLITASVVSYYRALEGLSENYIKRKKEMHKIVVRDFRHKFYAHSCPEKMRASFDMCEAYSILSVSEVAWKKEWIIRMRDLIHLALTEIEKDIIKKREKIMEQETANSNFT